MIRLKSPWIQCACLLLVCSVLFSTGNASALYVNIQPYTFGDVEQSIKSIEDDLEQAECGGWNFNESVAGKVAQVSGVPGRDGDPLGHIASGMAWRVEEGGVSDGPVANTGFIYPDEVHGFTSACRPTWPPFYEWHSCQRPSMENTGQMVFGAGSKALTEDPECAGGVCTTVDPLGNGVEWTCDALMRDLNRRWHWELWVCPNWTPWFGPCYDKDTETRPQPPPEDGCVPYAEFYCCTNAPVITGDWGGEELSNAQYCRNEECRTELDNPFGQFGYASYFRYYEGSCWRDTVSGVPEDDARRDDIPVACYGLYDENYEFDPKERVSWPWDRRCTIATGYEGLDFADMKNTQKTQWGGPVEYGDQSAGGVWPDPPSPAYGAPRNPQFDEETDVWYPNLSGGFSLMNAGAQENEHQNDLSFALLSLDTAQEKATVQLTENTPLSKGSLIRSFEDTVTNERTGRRTIAEWWQEVETEMNKLLTPPRVRLILPPAWATGLDPTDPFFSPPRPGQPQPPTDPQLEPVEVMIEAREDVLGGMLAYLKRTILLQFIEEPVPVVVPMGDPVELRILANAWCTWYMEKNRADSCDGISGNAAGIVQRLREYADRIEEARSLRAELSHYQAKWLDHQHEIIDTIGQWLHTNVQQYQAYLESVREMQALRTYWQYIQAYYRHFHDDSNMPWCRNDRFTTSIYSLLDDINIWFPGRRDGAMDYSAGIDGPPTSGGNTTLPRITVQQLPDAVLDFSLIANAAGSLRIPVIKPVQVRLDTLTYAPPGFDSDNVPEPPPSLPPIPSILALLPGDVLNVEIEGAPPQLRAFFPPRPPEIDRSALDNMRDIVGRMDYAYVRFWKSLVRNPDDVVDGTEEDCVRWDDGPCMHVEMDLRERFQRMCARPAVILKEDLESIGEPRNPAVEGVADCPREDWACQYLNAQREYPSYGFGITAPENESQLRAIELIRGRITEQTHLGLPAEQRSPYAVPPNTITPSFGVPGDTDISPFDEDAEEEEPPPNQ